MGDVIDWDHVYLLGWYDHDRRSYLSTWDSGPNPPKCVDVVVLGLTASTGPPLWNSRVPAGASMVQVVDEDPHDAAARLGGLYAFGWYFPDGGVQR